MKEDIFNGSKKIDDPKMAEDMARASDDARTTAAGYRQGAKLGELFNDLEYKTLMDKLYAWFGRNRFEERRGRNQQKIEEYQKNARITDIYAEELENKAEAEYLAEQNSKGLTNAGLEDLIGKVFSSLPREIQVKGDFNMNDLDDSTRKNIYYWSALYGIYQKRKFKH